MGDRIHTGKVLLIQYGPTMTLAQVKAQFLPGLTDKSIRNRVSRGDLPPIHNGVFDSQQVGEWWDSYCTAAAPRAA